MGGAGLPPVLRGSPFKFLFTTYNRPMFWLFARPEIRDVKALKGQKVGVSGIGSGPDSLLRETLRQHGLDRVFDVFAISEELGCEKPDRRMFDHVMTAFGLNYVALSSVITAIIVLVPIIGGEHAFGRDIGPRFDPHATDRAFAETVAFFQRVLR